MITQSLTPNLSLSHISLASQIIDEKKARNFPPEIPRHGQTIAWWVIIHTTIPNCTYYFGPFSTLEEAQNAQYGYIEDLSDEKAQGLKVSIKQCQPLTLTIINE